MSPAGLHFNSPFDLVINREAHSNRTRRFRFDACPAPMRRSSNAACRHKADMSAALTDVRSREKTALEQTVLEQTVLGTPFTGVYQLGQHPENQVFLITTSPKSVATHRPVVSLSMRKEAGNVHYHSINHRRLLCLCRFGSCRSSVR